MEGLCLLADYGIATVPAKRAGSLAEALDARAGDRLSRRPQDRRRASRTNPTRMGSSSASPMRRPRSGLCRSVGTARPTGRRGANGARRRRGCFRYGQQPQFGPYVMAASRRHLDRDVEGSRGRLAAAQPGRGERHDRRAEDQSAAGWLCAAAPPRPAGAR